MAVLSLGACQVDGEGNQSPDQEGYANLAALDIVSAAEVEAADTCSSVPTIAVTPGVIPPTRAGVPVVLDVAVTNTNPASCEPQSYEVHIVDTGLYFDPRPDGFRAGPTILPLASGTTGHLTVTATAPASADAGDVFPVVVGITEQNDGPPPPIPVGGTPTFPVTNSELSLTVAGAPGCQVSTSHELMITNVSVVDDPVRTVFDATSSDPRNGVWTFKHLAESMAATPLDAPAMIEAMLAAFTAPQTVNGFTVAARPGIQSLVLDSWPRTADGALDLAQAPLRLQAIVNRFDLRNLAHGDAGEGRFVFAFDLAPAPGAPPPDATVIFEYKLPAAHDSDVLHWAHSFHALGALPFGENYNAALQAITERFARRGARPGHPNGSAINAVRTNEIPFGDNLIWELREFHLSPISGRLELVPVELTPDLSFNNSDALATFINANQAQIIAETFIVPEVLNGAPFQGGAVLNDLNTWFAPGVDSEARHHFAINTCNGCHSVAETGTPFLHLTPRTAGAESPRSRWLTGTVIDDPVTGQPRTFDDLGRRKADLKAIVCSGPSEPRRGNLRKGIHRAH